MNHRSSRLAFFAVLVGFPLWMACGPSPCSGRPARRLAPGGGGGGRADLCSTSRILMERLIGHESCLSEPVIPKLYPWILVLFALAVLAFGIGSYSCERASWPHEDGVWGTGEGPQLRTRETVVHEQALSRLHAWSQVLEAASALSLAGLLLTAVRRPDRARSSPVALVAGMVFYGVVLYLGLSVMDYDPTEQRAYAGTFKILDIACLGCLLGAGILGLTSKRLRAVVTGVVAIVASAIIISIACH